MSEQPQDNPIDEQAGLAALMQVAGVLLQAGAATRDPRVLKIAGAVVDELKSANALEMLLIAQAEQQDQPNAASMMPSTIAANMLRHRQQQRQTPDYTGLVKQLTGTD